MGETRDYIVILFYKFVEIEDPKRMMKEQRQICADLGLKGRMLLASEGVNATFEGAAENIQKYKERLKENPLFANIVFKESASGGNAFTKLEIKVRNEVVTLGAGKFDVEKETAPEITAEELEKMYENDEDFVVLDLRNDFEINVGKFEKTVDPGLQNFRDLPRKIERLKDLKKEKLIAVCTGGIRCEKATCLLKREGFDNLYQLKDGIHTYMQKFPGKRFKGSLFVFDNRMTTPVVDSEEREVIGECIYCGVKCEEFYSNDTVRPSRKVICCEVCAEEHSHELRKCIS
jgi:UPF0176 protein